MDKLISDLKTQIIAQLNLQDTKPEDIGDDQPLFVEGLGLDSIDALELIVLLQQNYKIKLSNAEDGPKVFKTVKPWPSISLPTRLRIRKTWRNPFCSRYRYHFGDWKQCSRMFGFAAKRKSGHGRHATIKVCSPATVTGCGSETQ